MVRSNSSNVEIITDASILPRYGMQIEMVMVMAMAMAVMEMVKTYGPVAMTQRFSGR